MRSLVLIYYIFFQLAGVLTSSGQSIITPYILSGAYTKDQPDVFSFESNPAILSRIKHFNIGLFAENKYLIKELNAYQLMAVCPTRFISFGVQLNRFGNSNYNKYALEIDFSKQLSSMVDVAIGFNYNHSQITSSEIISVVEGNMGILLNAPSFSIGFCAKNIISSQLKIDQKNQVLSEYRAGIGYHLSDNFLLNLTCLKTENQPINYLTAFQVQWNQRVFFRLGFINESNVMFGGLALLWKQYRLDFSASFHQQLGISPGFGISTNNSSLENSSKKMIGYE